MPKLNRPPLPVVVEHDTPMPMRDGTVLRGSVHRPADGGPFPALLVRTPYGEESFRTEPVLPALRAGFAVVLQHCRGRGTSDGEFRPWLDEGADGHDTIAWITSRPWSNGEVVMSGMSYLAGCALQAAATRPPGLKAVVAAMTPHDFHDGLKYHGGAFALGSALNWGRSRRCSACCTRRRRARTPARPSVRCCGSWPTRRPPYAPCPSATSRAFRGGATGPHT